jgi:two-component system OmpR family response regulator
MRFLLVEDDPEVARFVIKGLGEAGHSVEHAPDGREGLYRATGEVFDALIVDRMLPGGIDGLTMIETLRRAGSATPVLILSALAQVDERVRGLKAGGDDYLTKPFNTPELLARLRALLRRAAGRASASLASGDLVLDPGAALVTLAGQPVRLTSLEYRLLHYLMMHAGRVVSRTDLVEHLYDQDFDRDSNTMEVIIARLRKKIGADRILTQRGLGYRLADPAGAG